VSRRGAGNEKQRHERSRRPPPAPLPLRMPSAPRQPQRGRGAPPDYLPKSRRGGERGCRLRARLGELPGEGRADWAEAAKRSSSSACPRAEPSPPDPIRAVPCCARALRAVSLSGSATQRSSCRPGDGKSGPEVKARSFTAFFFFLFFVSFFLFFISLLFSYFSFCFFLFFHFFPSPHLFFGLIS